MSQQHQDCFNLLRPLIGSYTRRDGVMSLYMQATEFILKAIGDRVGVQNMGQLMDELGFTLSFGSIVLLPHPFDIDMVYYERNVIGELSADNTGRLNFAFIVQRTHRVHEQVDAYLDYFRYFPPSPL
ncbi:hypothetical protein KKJ06_22670 [Xenorhabdus bovienii]|uniref:hypothetical protein n=1 Tax=Xenorhabdus bovienii TaxID=40576 RepID=UPI0023B2F0EB|nr:hypothetical protein [Xenorhabdus bovienii]MDE9553049.1 hypothetical protein [Xenorhabdus bovienii]MDE9558093.1 hypothetical protein [Xenorhabdus bovienii]